MYRPTPAGKFLHLMQFQYDAGDPTRPSSVGDIVHNWLAFVSAPRHVSIEPLSAREIYAYAQVQADVTHRIKLRYLPGLSPAMRGIYQGRIFNLFSVRDVSDERKIEMECLAKEEV